MVWALLNESWLRWQRKWWPVNCLNILFLQLVVAVVAFQKRWRFWAQNTGEMLFRSRAHRGRRRLVAWKSQVGVYLHLLHFSTRREICRHNHLANFAPSPLEHGSKTVSFHSVQSQPWRPSVLSMWHQHGEQHECEARVSRGSFRLIPFACFRKKVNIDGTNMLSSHRFFF